MSKSRGNRERKRKSIRKKISGTSEMPRLAVFRSSKNIYAQLIDDTQQKTITAVSTISPDLKKEAAEASTKIEAAKLVGKQIAIKAKKLEIVGVGYKSELKNNRLVLQLGYSHSIVLVPPEGIQIKVENQRNISVSGIDKELVGQVAAKIRSFRPPEPFKNIIAGCFPFLFG